MTMDQASLLNFGDDLPSQYWAMAQNAHVW